MDEDPSPTDSLPAYELSQAVFDSKTNEAVQQSLTVQPDDRWEEWDDNAFDAASLARQQNVEHSLPQPSGSTSRSTSPAATSSSAPLSRIRVRPRPPLPPIPLQRYYSKREQRQMGARSRIPDAVSRKEAERYLPSAPSWAPQVAIVGSDPHRPGSSQAVHTLPSVSDSVAMPVSQDPSLAAVMNADDLEFGEAPPPWAAVGPSLEGPPFDEAMGRMQSPDPGQSHQGDEEDREEEIYGEGQIEPPIREMELPSSTSAQMYGYPDHLTSQSIASYHRHSLSEPISQTSPSHTSRRPRVITDVQDSKPFLPPPILFNPSIAYSQKDGRTSLRGITFEEDTPSTASDFYNPSVSAAMVVSQRRPPMRPRPSAGSVISGVLDPFTYSRQSGERLASSPRLSFAASVRSASPQPMFRSPSPLGPIMTGVGTYAALRPYHASMQGLPGGPAQDSHQLDHPQLASNTSAFSSYMIPPNPPFPRDRSLPPSRLLPSTFPPNIPSPPDQRWQDQQQQYPPASTRRDHDTDHFYPQGWQ